jgi:hypothetical protein
VLAQVRSLLAGSTFETHYLTVGGQLTLSVWTIDPQLDPSATTSGLAANNQEAFERGLSLSYEIIEQVPCVGRVFMNVNPMIVDSRYQTWYLDILPLRVFDGLDKPTAGQLVKAAELSGASIAFHRRIAPRPEGAPVPSPACDWPTARAAIESQFGAGKRNTAAYLMIGNPPTTQTQWSDYAATNVLVQAQWEIGAAAEADDAAILERLGRMAQAMACLQPPVDLFEVFIVDQSGRLVVFGQVPGALVRGGVLPLPPASVVLRHQEPTTSP